MEMPPTEDIRELAYSTILSIGKHPQPALRALELAREAGSEVLAAEAHVALASYYFVRSEKVEGVNHLTQARFLGKPENESLSDARFLFYYFNLWGRAYMPNTDTLAKAKEYLLHCMTFAQISKIPRLIQIAYVNIGMAEWYLGNSFVAIDYFLKCILYPNGDTDIVVVGYNEIGQILVTENISIISAIKVYENSLLLVENSRQFNAFLYELISLELCYMNILIGDMEKADEYLAKSLRDQQLIAEIDVLSNDYIRRRLIMAHLEFARKNYLESKNILQALMEGPLQHTYLQDFLLDVIALLAMAFLELGDYESANHYCTMGLKSSEQPLIQIRLHKILAKILAQNQQFAEAVEVQKKIFQLNEMQEQKASMNLSQYLQLSVRQAENNRILQKYRSVLKMKEESDTILLDNEDIIRLLAHDLSNPLGAIKLTLEMIEADVQSFPLEKRRARYRGILVALEKVLTMINGLENYAQTNKSLLNQQLNIQRENILQLIKQQIELFRATASAKGQTIRFANTLKFALALVDTSALSRILGNLLSNAIKYSPSNSEILVKLFISNTEKLAIQVIDQGIGISEEDQSKLFTKFGNTSNRPTGGESSDGFGLYGARKLARKMAGDITVYSAGKDRGSCFTLFLNPAPIIWQTAKLTTSAVESLD